MANPKDLTFLAEKLSQMKLLDRVHEFKGKDLVLIEVHEKHLAIILEQNNFKISKLKVDQPNFENGYYIENWKGEIVGALREFIQEKSMETLKMAGKNGNTRLRYFDPIDKH